MYSDDHAMLHTYRTPCSALLVLAALFGRLYSNAVPRLKYYAFYVLKEFWLNLLGLEFEKLELDSDIQENHLPLHCFLLEQSFLD